MAKLFSLYLSVVRVFLPAFLNPSSFTRTCTHKERQLAHPTTLITSGFIGKCLSLSPTLFPA